MEQKSHYIDDNGHQLHLKRIYTFAGGPPVLMLHGSMENGQIFYTASGKGLACYLAEQGFDVYVADFRGKGKSRPSIKDSNDHGQYEAINYDIPAFINYVSSKNTQKLHVICHSWGGVLLSSFLSKFPHYATKLATKLCFGTKRSINVKGLTKKIKVDLLWDKVAPALSKNSGFIDTKKFRFGAECETHKFLKQSNRWVKPSQWVDTDDGFDYAAAAKHVAWPKTWHITGINDNLLGHIDDVKAFVSESNQLAKISLLSKSAGQLVDYGHIDILTQPKARIDHFPEIALWLKAHCAEK